VSPEERQRRWRLALGGDDARDLSDRDQRLDRALSGLYDAGASGGGQGKGGNSRRGGLGSSAPTVARWLGDIREFFPSQVVQVIQKDAFERLGLKQMLLEPEFLAALEADVHLIADLIALRAAMPDKTKDTARQVVAKVVKEVIEKLESRTVEAGRGALNKQRRTSRPRFSDIDWPRTIRRNLQHWQAEHRTIVPERLVGYGRHARHSNLENVILCVDQSGSMATSVSSCSWLSATTGVLPTTHVMPPRSQAWAARCSPASLGRPNRVLTHYSCKWPTPAAVGYVPPKACPSTVSTARGHPRSAPASLRVRRRIPA
jgi:hypothetical protein